MSDEKAPISATVGILTFNSAQTLERALKSVKEFAEILICDGGSTDATREIALRYGARIIEQDSKFKNTNGTLRDFGGVRQQMLKEATNDWYLYIDSDETISDGLREDIRRISSTPVRSGECLVYRIPIRIVIDGTEIKHASNYPGYQFRFFNRKSGAYYIKPVHERITFDRTRVPIGTLENPWYVYATREESKHYLRETARYRALQIIDSMQHSWRDYVRFDVYRGLRASLGALLKSSFNYARYGFKDSAPIAEEMGRVISPLLYVFGVTRARFLRKIRVLQSPHPIEAELQLLPSLLARSPQKVFIDVGANAGAYVAVALKSIAAHKIYAIEPNALYAPTLRKFVGVHVDTVALSSEKRNARLKIPAIAGALYATRGTLEEYTENGETGAEYIDVTTQTLDQYVLERGLSVGVIKIDVEGHEKDVLQGARDTLRQQHPSLIVEIEQRHHTESIQEIFERILAYGYEGYFYNLDTKKYVSLALFSVDSHQRMTDFKTRRYVNNFVFVPVGTEAPIL